MWLLSCILIEKACTGASGVIDITNEGEALAWHAFDSVGTEIDRFVIDDQE